MKAAKKIKWDSAFFMERATPEWKQAPQVEAEPLKMRVKKFRMEDALRAWKAIGLKNDSAHIRDHMKMLAHWQGRAAREKIRIKKFNLDREA